MRGHEQHPGEADRAEDARRRAVPAGARAPARTGEAGRGPGLTAQAVTVLQGTAGNAAVTRMLRDAEASASAPGQAGQSGQSGQGDPARAAVERLTRSIEDPDHTVLKKLKRSIWAPNTWPPERLIPPGPARLKRILERRMARGEVFSEQDLEDIRTLSQANHQWLSDVGIGTYAEAEKYIAKGDYTDWLKLSPGKYTLVATLAYRANKPGSGPHPRDRIPGTPDYTMGRFMTTQSPGLSAREKRPLFDERDEQIRRTAVNTLHPAGLGSADRHADADKAEVTAYAEQDAKARDILTSVLLILQHGLKLYDPQEGEHMDEYEHDVIRALAHGGRVDIRIPAVGKGESPTALTDFLGITTEGELGEHVKKRDYATHRMSIGKNEDGKPGKFEEKGGVVAGAANRLSGAIGLGTPSLMGVNFSGGGLGSKDVNGKVVLPNGSHGHMLLVFTPPTAQRDGCLMVGIETIAPNAASPVGYQHDHRSTEATSNPESVLHGHKPDKIGSGGLKHVERLVDLGELTGPSAKPGGSGAQPGGPSAKRAPDWRTFLDQVKREWLDELNNTQDGSREREALYRRLIGPRARFRRQPG